MPCFCSAAVCRAFFAIKYKPDYSFPPHLIELQMGPKSPKAVSSPKIPPPPKKGVSVIAQSKSPKAKPKPGPVKTTKPLPTSSLRKPMKRIAKPMKAMKKVTKKNTIDRWVRRVEKEAKEDMVIVVRSASGESVASDLWLVFFRCFLEYINCRVVFSGF